LSLKVLLCDGITVDVGDTYLKDVIEQNLRYTITERYEFGASDLETISDWINPIVPLPYLLPNGIEFDSRASNLSPAEGYITVGFGSGRT
jgi:hypothetical protein